MSLQVNTSTNLHTGSYVVSDLNNAFGFKIFKPVFYFLNETSKQPSPYCKL